MWTERVARTIPFWATVFMVCVIAFVDVVLCQRLDFLIGAIPIIVCLIIAGAIAVLRYRYQPRKEVASE